MAITAVEVATLMQGVVNGTADGYVLFRLYDTKTTLINAYIAMVTRWGNMQIAEGTRTTYADLYDDLVLNVVCSRILGEHIMGQVMATGYGFTTLEMTVNTATFPDVLKMAMSNWHENIIRGLSQLQERIVIMNQGQYGPDPYYINEDYFRSTSPWRGIG